VAADRPGRGGVCEQHESRWALIDSAGTVAEHIGLHTSTRGQYAAYMLSWKREAAYQVTVSLIVVTAGMFDLDTAAWAKAMGA
jgi:hypothetical protein